MQRVYSYILIFTLIGLGLGSGCQSSQSIIAHKGTSFSFALIGDMPYGADGVSKFENLLSDINAHPGVEWVLHVGDIKTGGDSCSDEFLQRRLAIFQRFEKPFILIPGDNEWTDCHRETAGRYDPLERLGVLRTLLYPEIGQALGGGELIMDSQAMDERYSSYSEHVRWVKEGVIFTGLHIVGSANSMAPFPSRTRAHDEEASERMEAAIVWLREAFEEAHRINSPGVFLMLHANLQFGNANTVFWPFLEALEEEVIRFGRPVLLAHGDSHYFRIDKPLIGTTSQRRIEHFTRVETFGAGNIHWLRVMVDPNDANVFSIRQEIVVGNIESHGAVND